MLLLLLLQATPDPLQVFVTWVAQLGPTGILALFLFFLWRGELVFKTQCSDRIDTIVSGCNARIELLEDQKAELKTEVDWWREHGSELMKMTETLMAQKNS